MEFNGFEWDDSNREKCQKHGVSISEIEALLRLPPRIFADHKHSLTEQRWLAIGAPHRRWILVAFTFRQRGGEILVRPFSARFMHKQEIDRYA
jgi:uncharacterized protein